MKSEPFCIYFFYPRDISGSPEFPKYQNPASLGFVLCTYDSTLVLFVDGSVFHVNGLSINYYFFFEERLSIFGSLQILAKCSLFE